VQTASSLCCMWAYDSRLGLFHKLFNIFVENFPQMGIFGRLKSTLSRFFLTPAIDLMLECLLRKSPNLGRRSNRDADLPREICLLQFVVAKPRSSSPALSLQRGRRWSASLLHSSDCRFDLRNFARLAHPRRRRRRGHHRTASQLFNLFF